MCSTCKPWRTLLVSFFYYNHRSPSLGKSDRKVSLLIRDYLSFVPAVKEERLSLEKMQSLLKHTQDKTGSTDQLFCNKKIAKITLDINIRSPAA